MLGGELIGGSQSEEHFDYLENRIAELELSKKSLWIAMSYERATGNPNTSHTTLHMPRITSAIIQMTYATNRSHNSRKLV